MLTSIVPPIQYRLGIHALMHPEMEITTFYSGRHPSEIPLYSQSAVAYAVRVLPSTLRRWLLPLAGQHPEGYGEPLIVAPKGPYAYLSFVNMAEAFMVAELRRKASVSMTNIRRAVWYLRNEMGEPRPLLNERLLAGSEIYLEESNERLISLSRTGQYVFEKVVRDYINRIEIDQSGLPERIFPWVLNTENKSVMITPRIRFGKPVVSGTGIMTSSIHERFEAGETIEAIAESYAIKPDWVDDALAYETSPRSRLLR